MFAMNPAATTNWTAQSNGVPIRSSTSPFPAPLRPVANHEDEYESTDFNSSGTDDESEGESDLGTVSDDVVTTDTMKVKPGNPGASPVSRPRQDKPNDNSKDTKTTKDTPSLEDIVRKVVKEEFQMRDAPVEGITKIEAGTYQTTCSPPTTSNTSRVRPQPPPGYVGSVPSAHPRTTQEYPSQIPPLKTPEFSPRITGVQWSNTVPPLSPSGRPPGPYNGARPLVEVNAVDSKWGTLFDDKGVPSARWYQVLKGLGQYVLDEFLPKNTLVLTPQKVKDFYSLHKLDPEVYPLREIFKEGSSKLADLYQKLGCEYYLIPSKPGCRPTEPGLTLEGWSKWMTLFIQSYPKEEAKRFAKVIVDLPINAQSLLDGKPERLPKQISRHLLLDKPDVKTRMAFDGALRMTVEAMQLQPLANKSAAPTANERRLSQPRPISPRSRYRPPSADDPSPPSSIAGSPLDEDFRRSDRDRERDRGYRDSSNRTYENNGTARRDPLRPPSHSATGPAPSSTSRPPASNPRRRSSPPPSPYHRHSVSGIIGGTERGYPAAFSRSASDATIYPHRSEIRERDRERERERERGRDRDHRDRERERGRDAKSRGRDRENERRDSRRSASVVSSDRRGSRPSGRNSVIVKDERDNTGRRSPTYSDGYFSGKQAGGTIV